MALVILDYDGMLADTLDGLISSGQEACNRLGVRHLVTQEDISNLEVMSFPTYGRACEVPEHLIGEFVEICLNILAENESPPAIFPGLREVVEGLFADNHKIAIVTTNSSQNVHAFLTQHGLDSLVHAIYGVDTPGSKAQKIAMARERFAKNGEAVFMIGDSLSDIRAAKEAGVTSIAVTWGHQSLETLLRGEPNYVVNDSYELIHAIEGKNSSILGV